MQTSIDRRITIRNPESFNDLEFKIEGDYCVPKIFVRVVNDGGGEEEVALFDAVDEATYTPEEVESWVKGVFLSEIHSVETFYKASNARQITRVLLKSGMAGSLMYNPDNRVERSAVINLLAILEHNEKVVKMKGVNSG